MQLASNCSLFFSAALKLFLGFLNSAKNIQKSKFLLESVGFNVETLSRPKLGHGIDPEGISRGMEMLKQLN